MKLLVSILEHIEHHFKRNEIDSDYIRMDYFSVLEESSKLEPFWTQLIYFRFSGIYFRDIIFFLCPKLRSVRWVF